MAWTLRYAQSARTFVENIEPQARRRIRNLIEQHIAPLDDPRDAGRPVAGPLGMFWAYRVGNYCAYCDVRDDLIVVLDIAGSDVSR